MPSPRIACCVPFCAKTKKRDADGEWICGPHWNLLAPVDRRVWKRMRARQKRGLGTWQARTRIWDRIRRVVFERAAGI